MSILISALKCVRREPRFSLIVIGLTALGIGVTTAIFSVAHAVLLKPLSYPNPNELVLLRKPPREAGISVPGGSPIVIATDLEAWIEAKPKSFRAIAGFVRASSTLQNPREVGSVRLPGARVTSEFFAMFGASPALGALFTAGDFQAGGSPSVVLSHRVWRTRFQGDPDIVGTILRIDEAPHTVVGVLSPDFDFVEQVDFWRPLALGRTDHHGSLHTRRVRVFGRMRPGISEQAAKLELDEILDRDWGNISGDESANPDASTEAGKKRGPGKPMRSSVSYADGPVELIPLQRHISHEARTPVSLLLVASVLMLIVTCANSASVQLARAGTRRREIAVRAALGASPQRIAKELVTENLVLAGLGGCAGMFLAWLLNGWFQSWLTEYWPQVNKLELNANVLGYSALAALGSGLAFGLAPAWQGWRTNLIEALHGTGNAPQNVPGLRGLIVVDVALALTLVVNAGLLAESLRQLRGAGLGYRTDDVMSMNLLLPARYGAPSQVRAFSERWQAALKALPGVKTAALADRPPFSPTVQTVAASLTRPGAASPKPAFAVTQFTSVSPEYFKATGIALRSGRLFSELDATDAPEVAVVNEAFVRRHFPNGYWDGAPFPFTVEGAPPATIVGVVANTRLGGLGTEPEPMAYFPLAQSPSARLAAIVRFEGDPAALRRALARSTLNIDPDVAPDTPFTLAEQINRQAAPRQMTMALASAFAGIATLLAGVGIFGVMTYTVAQHTHELGVRVALGADRLTILIWMWRYSGGAVLTGVLVGLAVILASRQLLEGFLYGVAAFDRGVVAGGVAIMSAVAACACLPPFVRALRVNPLEALRPR